MFAETIFKSMNASTHPPAHLFSELEIREITFRNRIGVSPMCEYSSVDGFANDWHLVHLGSRAVGGAGLVLTEASAVLPEGRISPDDLGIWSDGHIEKLAQIFRFIEGQGAVPGMQLAHAGRKGSTYSPWKGRGAAGAAGGGWEPVHAPSAIPFDTDYLTPVAMDKTDIERVTDAFSAAARRALDAGAKVIEIHAAHGYLLDEFLSPLSNHRVDEYGGSFANRIRFVRSMQGRAPHLAGEPPAFRAHLGERLDGRGLDGGGFRGAGRGIEDARR